MLYRRTFLAAAPVSGIAAMLPKASHAELAPLGTPAGKPILRISGAITNRNTPTDAVFDMAMLEALGHEEFATKTPWYSDRVSFAGVPMRHLMAAGGALGTKLRVFALNDYASEIPIPDFDDFNVVLATKRDGHYMPVSDKGPLFIVYPYDSSPALQTQKYYSRSPWQVARMTVL